MRASYLLTALVFLLTAAPALAHFGMIIPEESMPGDAVRSLTATLSFSHPFEGIGMPLEAPKNAFVFKNGKKSDLKLSKTTVMDHKAHAAEIRLTRPGACTLVMEPHPYWEPEEDCFIIHYTKTTLAVWGDDTGWDEPVGLPTEIIPVSKPFGLYAGNVFQGQVLLEDRPVPGAEVEVEFYNQNSAYTAPSELMITQTVKADQNGVFTYAAPWPGWWGFAALNTAPYTLKHQGQDKDVELGAVVWVEFVEPVEK